MTAQPVPVLNAAFIRRFVRAARKRRLALARGEFGEPLTLRQLLDLHGQAGMPVLLIVLALITTVPVAGAGTVFSLGIMAWAWRWLGGHASIEGMGRLDFFQLSPAAAYRCLRWLICIYLFAHRWLRPRLTPLHSAGLRWLWSLWVLLMALVIFLPIPFGNLFPAVSLLMFGLGLLTRDGCALIFSLLLGLTGLMALVLAGGWLWQLALRFWQSLGG